MISALLLPVLLAGSIFEEIRLTDTLEVRAEYMEQGAVLSEEGMVLSVEDFGLLQGEYLTIEQRWLARIEDLKELHAEQVVDIQARCASQLKPLRDEITLLDERVNVATESARVAEREARFYKYVSYGLAAVAGVVTIYTIAR